MASVLESSRMRTGDRMERGIHHLDEAVEHGSGISLLNMLTAASMVASLAFFFAGKKSLGIFLGLWPPTFQALKSR